VYSGPWLPEPIEAADLPEPAHEPRHTEARYELLESVSYAFLLALEALTPTQRAVLILCDVIEYSARETAQALSLSEANVRVVLHRARKALAGYDAQRCIPTAELSVRTAQVLQQFLEGLATGDVPGVEALLAADVVALNDANGTYSAARVPVRGRNKVARFQVKIAHLGPGARRYDVRLLNGLPAFVAEWDDRPRHLAPRIALIPVLDAEGRIRALAGVLAPEKLARVSPCDSHDHGASRG